MSTERVNRLLKEPKSSDVFGGDEQPDSLPDLDILDHVDISFLMDYSLDGEEAVRQADDYEFKLEGGSELEVEVERLEKSGEGAASPLLSGDSALQDEFLGLFSKDFDEPQAESIGSQYALHEKQVFGDVFEDSEQSVPGKETASVELEEPPLGIQQDHCTSFRRKRFSKFGLGQVIRIGLDIGSHAIKYVVVQKSGKRDKLLAYGVKANSVRKNSTEDEIVKYILNDLKFKAQFPRSHISWNIQGKNVGLKRLSFPQMKKQMLEEAILWSAKKDFGLEDIPAIVDYVEIGKDSNTGGTQRDHLVIGCAEDSVVPKAATFLAEKFVPSKATPHANALWKLYETSEHFDSGKCFAVIDLGAENTTIAFINKGTLEFAREIPTGGKDITDALTGTIFYEGTPHQLSQREAERLKLTFGFPNEDLTDKTENGVPVKEYSVLIRPILERLGTEIRRSIDYHKEHFSNKTLERVLLMGGTSKLANIIPYVSEFVDCEIEQISTPSDIAQSLSETDWSIFVDRYPELALPLSLATDQDAKLNLLPAFFKRLKKLKILQRVSVYAVTIGLSLLAVFSAYSHFRSQHFQSQYNMMEFQYKRLEPLKKRFDQLTQQRNLLSNRKNVYSRELILENPLPEIMTWVSSLLPKRMSLRSMTLEQASLDIEKSARSGRNSNKKGVKQQEEPKEQLGKVLHLSGVARSPRPEAGIYIADFMLNLNKSDFFESVKLVEQSYNEEDDELLFEIQGSIRE